MTRVANETELRRRYELDVPKQLRLGTHSGAGAAPRSSTDTSLAQATPSSGARCAYSLRCQLSVASAWTASRWSVAGALPSLSPAPLHTVHWSHAAV